VLNSYLIFISIAQVPEKYFYYRPAHPKGLSISSSDHLKRLRFGTHTSEENGYFEQAGVNISYGRTIALLKRLKKGELDFISAPPLEVEWLIDRFMADEKNNFVSTPDEAGVQRVFIIFNRNHAKGEASAEKFRQAFSAMQKDGRFDQIVGKHLGREKGRLYLRRLESFRNGQGE